MAQEQQPFQPIQAPAQVAYQPSASAWDSVMKGMLACALAVGSAAFGWVWNASSDITVAQLDIDNMKRSHAEKLKELDVASAEAIERVSQECQDRVKALRAESEREHETIRASLTKVDVIAKRGDENSLALARVEVKMESVSEKLDEIKKLLE